MRSMRAGGALQVAEDFAERADRAGDHHRIEDEGGQLAAG